MSCGTMTPLPSSTASARQAPSRAFGGRVNSQPDRDYLGAAGSQGTIAVLPPTIEITEIGQEEKIDGVDIRFQITPGTECPAQMNFLFPPRRALCKAENATHNLHNLLTLRGAEVRDARMWSRYLAEAIEQ
jgi:alkyl sulfatase BDS1-like metallo-beta-lactamase superfamily hydrolase